jgi:outer membrane receptor for ferrienterochelin and colicins
MKHGLATARFVRSAVWSSVFLALPLAAGAQESAADDITVLAPTVVTAAGFEQKVTDAPASISVITREDLQKRPYTTLLDAVRDLEGVDIGEDRDKTGQGTISMRGMGADYTLILVDGRRQNNHGDIYPNNFGGNQFNHIPPLDAIERIEVIRGPASTLYGADAMGGVINIITKKVTEQWGGSVSHGRTYQIDDEFGNDITTDFSLSGPLLRGKLGLALRGSLYNRLESNPSYASVTDPAGVEHKPSMGFGGGGKTVDNENKSLGARLSWTIDARQSLSLDADTSRQRYDNRPKINDTGVSEYPVGTVDDYGAMLRIGASGRIEPRAGYAAEQEFDRETWSLTHEGEWDFGNSFVSLAYVATNNHGRTLPFSVAERQEMQLLWNAACTNLGGTVGGSGFCPVAGTGYANPNAWNNLSEAQKLQVMAANLTPAEYGQLQAYLPRGKRTMESRQYTLDAKLDMPFELAGSHIAVVGAQVIRGELEDGVFGMESGAAGAVQEHNMYSVFAEDTWYVISPLAVTAGLRYDDHEVFGNQLSPRLYGVYTLGSEWTIKGGVATGYKTPKTSQLYDGVIGFGGQGVSPLFGNPNLQPETSVSTELAAYWQHPAGHHFNVTVFQNTFDDKIDSQPCGGVGEQACASAGDYGDLGYTSGANRTTNIDKVVIQGAELAGRWQIVEAWALRANYTYTDSEQKSGAEKGQPLGKTAKHMANVTLSWEATERLGLFLTSELRSDRYRSWNATTGKPMYYKDYEIFHLGASFKASPSVTFNGRINNLLDKDFTTYQTEFTPNDNGTAGDPSDDYYTPVFTEDYNHIDKARNVWVGVNVTF